MSGAWFREDGEMVWKDSNPHTPDVDMADNPVTDVILGPKGEVLSMWLEREPIGFKATRWAKNAGKK